MGNIKTIPRIDYNEQNLHDGMTFEVFLTDDTMADNATINFAFKTPASTSKQIHLTIHWTFKAGGTLDVKEAVTWTAKTGTIFVPINVNRLSSNVSEILGNETTTVFTANEVAYNVTTILTTNATTIHSDGMFGTNQSGGEGMRASTELILASETKYVVIATADGASNACHLSLRWSEELPDIV
ncbi:hypothetical protein LCGC14_1279280 [marine sediment metagenome]|uniref:Uncharacterized protein n=1 Tax=marine sediment metagenome TaxID=412755 RepID=A0A0F9LH02_9ZZZZ